MPIHCPLCGQLVRHVRDGVFFSAKRAQIYDLVKCNDGISGGEIAYKLAMEPVTVRNHVRDINARLEEFGARVRIKNLGWGYQIIKVKGAVDA